MDFDFSTVFILPIAGLLAVMACRGLEARERQIALYSFAAHCACSFAQWAIMQLYYGGGTDFSGYQGWGIQLSRLMDADFVQYVPEVIKLALHIPPEIPLEVTGEGSSTGTMSALAGLYIFVAGPSLVTMCLGSAWFSWFGQLCAYRVAREELRPEDRRAALIAFLLVPSVIFWGGGYTKESFVVGFFGILALGASRLFRHRNLRGVVYIVVGATGIGLLKAYTLFAIFVAFGGFVYADRAWRNADVIRLRPGYMLLAGAVSLGGVVLMGRVFPQFSTDRVGETIANNQQTWQVMHGLGTAGGSAVDIGDGEARSLAGQLVFAPTALVNAFFRPVIFEARGAPMLGAAVESTLLTYAILSLLAGAERKIVIDTILRTPLLVFGILFCLVFGIGVGLATSNLGTLSRYRVPMMPFYVLTVLLLRERSRLAKAATVPGRLLGVRRSSSTGRIAGRTS